ncbi:MAG: hypothetical protein MUC33_18345 [Desulfobacterales bacterium]|nr:hypothetical protein [Desulfobacterales bacterium]
MNRRHRSRFLTAAAFLFLAVMLAAGCSGANRGGLRNSREVGRAFETFHAEPNHRYWYYNQENNPYAVVGLKPPYRIEDINWKEVDPNSKTFEKVIGLVQGFPVRGSFTYGAYILDPQAQPIGMWYSSPSTPPCPGSATTDGMGAAPASASGPAAPASASGWDSRQL